MPIKFNPIIKKVTARLVYSIVSRNIIMPIKFNPIIKKVTATIIIPKFPMFPKSLPIIPVIIPKSEIDTRIPRLNSVEIKNAFLILILPCPFINATIKGMLLKWHGLSITLNIPQENEPISAKYQLL